jgi:hypothetical protein
VDESAQLLERERELDRIAGALGDAADGVGSVLLVEGPAGIGKATLGLAAADEARSRRMHVLRAAGRELERDFPYGVVRQLLDRVLRYPIGAPSAALAAEPRKACALRIASTVKLGALSRTHTTYAVPACTGSAVIDSLSLKKCVASKIGVVPWSDFSSRALPHVFPPSLDVTVATPVSLFPAATPPVLLVASRPEA